MSEEGFGISTQCRERLIQASEKRGKEGPCAVFWSLSPSFSAGISDALWTLLQLPVPVILSESTVCRRWMRSPRRRGHRWGGGGGVRGSRAQRLGDPGPWLRPIHLPRCSRFSFVTSSISALSGVIPGLPPT